MEESVNHPIRSFNLRAKVIVVCVIAVLAAIVAIALLLTHNGTAPSTTSTNTSLPSQTFRQVSGFTPYFFPKEIPFGFQADQNTTNYESGVLFIPLTNKDNHTVVITQQSMPDDFAASDDLIGDEKVKDVYGKAAVSHRNGRTIGTMISRDKKSLIILTAPPGVSTATVHDLLRALRPVSL